MLQVPLTCDNLLAKHLYRLNNALLYDIFDKLPKRFVYKLFQFPLPQATSVQIIVIIRRFAVNLDVSFLIVKKVSA